MSPISLVAGIFGLLTRPSDPGKHFYEALRWGKSTEQWIDLFGALRDDPDSKSRGMDDWLRKVEDAVTEQYEKGGMTRRAKDRVDRALTKLHEDAAEDSDMATRERD